MPASIAWSSFKETGFFYALLLGSHQQAQRCWGSAGVATNIDEGTALKKAVPALFLWR